MKYGETNPRIQTRNKKERERERKSENEPKRMWKKRTRYSRPVEKFSTVIMMINSILCAASSRLC